MNIIQWGCAVGNAFDFHSYDFLFQSLIKKQMIAIDSDPLLDPLEKAQRKQSIYLAFSINNSGSVASAVSPLSTPFYPASDTVESVVGEDIIVCLWGGGINNVRVFGRLGRAFLMPFGSHVMRDFFLVENRF